MAKNVAKAGLGLFNKVGGVGRGIGAGFAEDAAKRGQTTLGMATRLGVQSGAIGAGVGGTTEALQGGSFWEGAKQGAFNGAVGLGGVRALKRGTGATSRNPFAGGGKGSLSQTGHMWKSMSKDPEVAKTAQAMIGLRQSAAITNHMNGLKS